MRALAPLAAVFLAITACSDAENGVPAEASTGGRAAAATSPYALLNDDGWTLQEAIDPRADAAIVALEQPPLAWYAEYLPASASESGDLRLSGHHGPFAETRSILEGRGFFLDDLSLQHWQGVGGSIPADPASPTIVVLVNGATTLMLLSSGRTLTSSPRSQTRSRVSTKRPGSRLAE